MLVYPRILKILDCQLPKSKVLQIVSSDEMQIEPFGNTYYGDKTIL